MTRLPARQTLLLILVPLLATFAGQRLFLHLVGVHHVRTNGLIIHHLFFGVLLVLPSAFVIAFNPRRRWAAMLACVVMGIGSAMVLDEIVYLVATPASDSDYVSPLSLWGAVIFISLAVLLLLALFRLHRNDEQPGSK
ncbi:MAG: hypothetical protein EPO07_01480 [Verrucomicrobia bacterium]|nr:MAG: hypothetical protein EPO07_01480 [Verrucomicrobiota bacterium]